MKLIYADNVNIALAAGKASGSNEFLIAAQLYSGDWYQAFGPGNTGVVPITVLDSSGAVLHNGFIESWAFYTDDTKLYCDANLAALAIASDCTLAVRLRTNQYVCAQTQHRQYAINNSTDNPAYVIFDAYADCEYSVFIADLLHGGIVEVDIDLDAGAVDDSSSHLETPPTSRRKVILLEDVNANVTSLTIHPNGYDAIKWTDGSAPAFSAGYRRLRITLDVISHSTWVGSWEKFAD